MAVSKEAEDSKQFILDSRDKYGNDIFIEKRMSELRVGEPDVSGCFRGMPFYFEVKHCNEISYVNNHEFKPMQIYNLQEREKTGALCLGLLIHKTGVKYIYPQYLKKHFTKQEFLDAEVFEWQKLRSHWVANILTNY